MPQQQAPHQQPEQPAVPSNEPIPDEPVAEVPSNEPIPDEAQTVPSNAPIPDSPAPAAPASANNMDIDIPDDAKVFTSNDAAQQNAAHISVPEGYQVIADCAFSGNQVVEAIDLPSTIIHIGERAFENCTKLITVNIHEGVQDIGRGAFAGCSSLTKLTLPSTIRRIRQSTFSGCEKLAEFNIPQNVKGNCLIPRL